MHPRNIHKKGYNFSELVKTLPALADFVRLNPMGSETIDFANVDSVKILNAALLKHDYKIDFWDIPHGYLCPPVPGRADYIHAIADLIDDARSAQIAKAQTTVGLDIGTGANLIYPILGKQIYGWRFVASDIDKTAVQSASLIQSANKTLKKSVQLRHQQNPNFVFKGVINRDDQFAFSMCNPPFHSNQHAALAGTQRKNNNLSKHQQRRNSKSPLQSTIASKNTPDALNFAGKANELWCDGGELGFIQRMISESVEYKNQIMWFTSLVSKKESLVAIKKALNGAKATTIKVIEMEQGNKVSRIIAWRF
jgi:23S rRNA (adenine1618-N6)-methyltransferase